MFKNLTKILCALSLLVLCFFCALAASKTPLSQQPKVHTFIAELVKDYKFDENKLNALFDSVTLQTETLDKMASPVEAKPWSTYKQLFITEKRVNAGVAYWKKHADTLSAVEKEYGVPIPIIVSILGIETNYGETQGDYPVFDTLTTLAFEHPSRTAFFKSELKELLLLARENHFDPTSLRGSYAGAIGQPQFMPSSYRRYAVDFTQNQQKDLLNSPEDSMASIAHFLKRHGWKTEQKEITVPAVLAKKHNQKYLKATKQPHFSVSTLTKGGITPQYQVPLSMKAMVITLNPKTTPEYWLGFENFAVIMKYNPRINYAMAVYQLSERIKKGVL